MNLKTLAQDLFQLELSEEMLAAFATYTALLTEWNQKINLTSITAPDDILIKHLLDSLSIFSLPMLPLEATVMDIGTGAGLPGLALQLVRPTWQVTLSDATAKKITFVQHVIAALHLKNAQAIQGRAEELGQHPQHREQYDLVTARAVARLPVLAEYMLPLLKVGGLGIAMKGETAPAEIADAGKALKILGGAVEHLQEIHLPTLEQKHYLICLRKVNATPPNYPRRAGLPAQKPLTS